MPPPRIPRTVPQPVKRERAGMSASHLAMVRQLPCCVCGATYSVQAHHLLRTGEHGMGRKSSDRWAISICAGHHAQAHGMGDDDAYLTLHGIDGRALASALWRVRGDIEAMQRVVFRAREEAQRKQERTA